MCHSLNIVYIVYILGYVIPCGCYEGEYQPRSGINIRVLTIYSKFMELLVGLHFPWCIFSKSGVARGIMMILNNSFPLIKR